MAMAGEDATMHGLWPTWKYINGPYFLAIFASHWCKGNVRRDVMESKMGGRGGKFMRFVSIDLVIR
jgi:hypothetical protein